MTDRRYTVDGGGPPLSTTRSPAPLSLYDVNQRKEAERRTADTSLKSAGPRNYSRLISRKRGKVLIRKTKGRGSEYLIGGKTSNFYPESIALPVGVGGSCSYYAFSGGAIWQRLSFELKNYPGGTGLWQRPGVAARPPDPPAISHPTGADSTFTSTAHFRHYPELDYSTRLNTGLAAAARAGEGVFISGIAACRPGVV